MHKVGEHIRKVELDFGLNHFLFWSYAPCFAKKTCLFELEVGTSMSYGEYILPFFQDNSLEMKISIYWSKSNSSIYFHLVLKKTEIYWSEQSLTGLGLEDRFSP